MRKMKTPLTPILATLAAATLLLGGCGSSPSVATYQGGDVSQEAFYQELKSSPSSKTILANLLIYRALDHAYGSSVSQAQVDKAYKGYQDQYGSGFDSYLSQNNYTKDSFKRSLRTNLLSEVALKKLKKVSPAQLADAWKDFHPQVTVQHILVSDQATAQQVIDQLGQGKDFSELAKTYSLDTSSKDEGGKVTFTSSNRAYASTFKDAAYALTQGKYTTSPVKVVDGYEVIKMVSNPSKGTFASRKKELTEAVYAKWLRDSTVMKQVISQVLKNEKVQIQDKDLSNALDSYKVPAATVQTK